MTDYVREYFDSRASAWLEQAYLQDPLPTKYRIGDERVRVTIEGVAGAVPAGGSLVDLGCGGGQLCLHAARLGWKVDRDRRRGRDDRGGSAALCGTPTSSCSSQGSTTTTFRPAPSTR